MSWKNTLAGRIPKELGQEIDDFAAQLSLRGQAKLEDKLFAEARLRRGVYGQRYDSGVRHHGAEKVTLAFPEHPTKGPNTAWHAPGMMRIKIPYGALTAAQLECMAQLADEYADGILHPTTRQDIQLHYVHIEDTPDLMRRLAAVGITTREACGNGVRNVTACPFAGVCGGEAFDITPYAHACAQFLLGHDDAQNFGRKFKISYSGCHDQPCGLTSIHDLGFVAKVRRTADGTTERGFKVVVGGGLGAVPHQAKLFDAFMPLAEMLPITQAICRVFAALGERKNRATARLKFLIAKIGVDAFVAKVNAERAKLPPDPRWLSLVEGAPRDDTPERAASPIPQSFREQHSDFVHANVRAQKQQGYHTITIGLPLGDLSSSQALVLADLARAHSALPPGAASMRLLIDQNIAIRWIPGAELPLLWQKLEEIGLGDAGAGTLLDVTACPGTDTCKLGIASSRGLAAMLRKRLAVRAVALDVGINNLRIKISGCFNACGQHHVADLGFYGVSRKIAGVAVPHFQVVVGGEWNNNGSSYGIAVGAVPSRRVPDFVDAVLTRYIAERRGSQSFRAYVEQVGREAFKRWTLDFSQLPEGESRLLDWGEVKPFTLRDRGKGECAGQVVSAFDLGIAQSETTAFNAQIALHEVRPKAAAELALQAMLGAARSLLLVERPDIGGSPDEIINAFEADFVTTKLFFDPFAGGKFARYLTASRLTPIPEDSDSARQRIHEAQLFIEAAHACHARLG